MARTRITAARAAELQSAPKSSPRAGMSLDDFGATAKDKPKKKRPRKMRVEEIEVGIVAVLQRVRATHYADMQPKEFVYLYAWSHREVYGVLPTELQRELGMATLAAGRMLDKAFGGACQRMVAFIAWTWAREKESFAKRDGDFRISWKYQFVSERLLTDFRVWQAKRGRIK